MDIEFCDLCNESVPVSDFAKGLAFRRKGRVVCASCDAAMGGGLAAASAAGGTAVAQARPQAAAASRLHAPAQGAHAHTGAGAHPAAHAGGSRRPSRSGVLGAVLGVVAIGAVGGGGALVAERLDGLEAAVRASEAGVRTQFDQLGRERAAALRPVTEDLDRVESASLAAAEEAREAAAARAGELERRLDAAEAREQALLATIEGLRADVREVRSTAEGIAEETRETLTNVENVLDFHGNRLIQLEERIREAGALAAAGGVPGAAAAPGGTGAAPPRWQEHLPDLQNADAALRLDAVSHLAETGDAGVVPHILPLLGDPDLFVRMVVAQALGQLGAKTAVPDLIDRLEDDSVTVREAAVIALRDITGRRFGFEPDAREADRRRRVEDWRSWWRRSGDDFLSGS